MKPVPSDEVGRSTQRGDAARRQTFRTLQAGRGLAAILVVIFHTGTFLDADPRYWHHEREAIGLFGLSLGVEYFFVLSGAVMLMAHRNDIGRPATIPAYLWKRFRRVYPIYWVVLTVVVAEYALRPGLGAAYQTSPWVIVSGYLLIYIRTLQVNLPVAWTLFHEVLFYAIFASLLYRRRVGAALLGLWFGLSILMLIHPWSIYFGYYLLSPLHLFFGFGIVVAWLLHSRKVPAAGMIAALGAVAFAAAVVWGNRRAGLSFSIELLAGFGAALLVLGGARLEEQGRLRVPHFLQFAGDASYSIYLIHYPFFMFFAPLLYKGWLLVRVPLFVPFWLMAGCGVGVGCLLHLWVEEPILRWLRPRRRSAICG